MKLTIFQKRFLSGILILVLGISGIWTGKIQGNAFLYCDRTSLSSWEEGQSQAYVQKSIHSTQKDHARIEETGLKTFQHFGRINRGSRTEQGRGNPSFINCMAGIPLSFYRHKMKVSLRYCLAHRLQGAGWQTIISFIHGKDGAKGGEILCLTDTVRL